MGMPTMEVSEEGRALNPLKACSNYCSGVVVFTKKTFGKVSYKVKRAAFYGVKAALK